MTNYQEAQQNDNFVLSNEDEQIGRLAGICCLNMFLTDVDEMLADVDLESVDTADLDTWFNKTLRNDHIKANLKKIGHVTKRITVVAACVLLAFILLITTLFFTVEPVRAQILRLLTERFREYSTYTLTPDDEVDDIITYYEPTYIPEGFVIAVENKLEGTSQMIYRNEGYKSKFSIGQVPVGGSVALDTEDAVIKPIMIGDSEAELILKNGRAGIVFSKGNYMLSIMGPFDEATTIRIAEGLVPVE